MAYSPPTSPSDNVNFSSKRPSSVPSFGARTKLDNMRMQFSILPNRMSVFPSKEKIKMIITPSTSPKPGQYAISRPSTSLGFTAMPHRSLLSRENDLLTFGTDNVLNRLPRISMLQKSVYSKAKEQASSTKIVGDTKDREMSKNLRFVDERILISPPLPIRSSPISIPNAVSHAPNNESELGQVASRLSTGAIEEALSELESEMNIAAEESALQAPRSCASLMAEVQNLDRDRVIVRVASRMSTDAIELALSEMSDETQIEEKSLRSSLSPVGVHNAVINELDKENALSREASRLSIHAIEMAMSEVDAEMSTEDMAALNTPSSANRSLIEVSKTIIQEMTSGQELERAVSQLSNDAIEIALKETEEELKPAKQPTIADGISVIPKNARSTVQMPAFPLFSKAPGLRPSVIQSQLVVAISKDMFACVIAGAMTDIQKELSLQTAFASSPNIDMPLFVRNKPFASKFVGHFKPPSRLPANPPIINNRMLLAVTVNLCKDVVKLAMTEIQAEVSLMNPATPNTTGNRTPYPNAASHNVLQEHLVLAPANGSFDMALQENMTRKYSNIPSLKELATKTSAKHGLLEQHAKVHGRQQVGAAVPSLKKLASEKGVKHGLLAKPDNEYRYTAANVPVLCQNVIGDSNNLKPPFPSLKDLAANIATRYGLLIKPASTYQLPSAKVDAMKKKLSPNQKMLLERPGWIKQKCVAKETKIPISINKKKPAATKKKRLDISAIQAEHEANKDTQRYSTVKTRSGSNKTPRATEYTIETPGNASKVKERRKTTRTRKLSKEKKKLIKKIENGQHVSDKETVSLLKFVEPSDDQVGEMLKEIEDIETLAKDIKDSKKHDKGGVEVSSNDKLIPCEEMKTIFAHVAEAELKAFTDEGHLITAAGNRMKEKVDNSRDDASLQKGNIAADADRRAQLTDALDDQPTANIGDHNKDRDSSDTSHKRKKKKLSVNKQPDIVPRMNKHALRLMEENAKKTKDEKLNQAIETNKAKMKRRNLIGVMENESTDTRMEAKTGKSKLPKEQRTPRITREPLRPVRATKATEARLKHVERLKEEAAARETQIREERLKDAEIQKAREISRARALDHVRAKRRQEITQKKPWDPLMSKKMTRPVRLPPIKQTNGVSRQTHELYDTDAESHNLVRSQEIAGQPTKSHRRAKASRGGLLIARM